MQIKINELAHKLIKTLDLKIYIYKKYQSIKMDEHLEVFDWVHAVLSQKVCEDVKDRVLHHLNVLV